MLNARAMGAAAEERNSPDEARGPESAINQLPNRVPLGRKPGLATGPTQLAKEREFCSRWSSSRALELFRRGTRPGAREHFE